MRIIESHKTNDCNEAITITADDRDPDNGNASHHYELTWPHGNATDVLLLDFQRGPIKEVGVNGVTNEALLALLIDRMEGFQTSKWACTSNEITLTGLRMAAAALAERTKARVERAVEGTHEV